MVLLKNAIVNDFTNQGKDHKINGKWNSQFGQIFPVKILDLFILLFGTQFAFKIHQLQNQRCARFSFLTSRPEKEGKKFEEEFPDSTSKNKTFATRCPIKAEIFIRKDVKDL